MSEISKQALLVDNSQSFPNNNAGAITPANLRAFNVNMIDSLVDEISYNVDSSSWNNSISRLNTFTSSQQPTFNALNSFTASQLTINTGVNTFTQSTSGRLTALENDTANLELFTSSINQILVNGVSIGTSTRLFFNGFVSASIVPNIDGAIASITVLSDPSKLNSSSFNDYTASQAIQQTAYSASVSASLNQLTQFSASQNIINQSVTASLQELLNLSSSLSGGYATQGELDQSASVLQANIDTKLNTSSFNTFTASQYVSNSYFATTGSNTFTGDQTLIDNAGNFYTITDTSGSMMLVAKSFTSASAHLSSSVPSPSGSFINLIFKFNNNTADTIISGSGNIFTNPTAQTAGFKRYIGGSGNIFSGPGAVPQISGSMGFSPSMAVNYNVGGMTMRGPVSSSTWSLNQNNILGTVNVGTAASTHAQGITSGLALSQNVIPGILNIVANQVSFTGSTTAFSSNLLVGAANLTLNQSSAQLATNVINDSSFTLTNNYFSQSAGLGQVSVLRNNILGQGNSIIVTGSQPAGTTNAPNYNDNFMGGAANTIFADASTARVVTTNAYHSVARNIIFGQNLIVTGSSTINDTTGLGSAFFGRFNSVTGNSDMTAETIFAVGTGTSTSNRKTGFLIDSGSNTFVEGSLNVSGSTTITGSVYGNIVSMSIASQTASMDLSLGNFFTLQLVSGSTTHLTATNIRRGQTINLLVNQPSVGTGSLSYNTTFDFPAGANYIPTPITSSKDILTFITFDSSTIYATSINNLG